MWMAFKSGRGMWKEIRNITDLSRFLPRRGNGGPGKLARRWPAPLLILSIILPIAGCQTEKTISLDEAKTITATFQPTVVQAPPRTATDVLAVLDTYSRRTDAKFDTLKVLADQPIAGRLQAPEKAMLYLKRAAAAGQLGRAKQEIDDLSMAYRLGQSAPELPVKAAEIGFRLGLAQVRAGNFTQGNKRVQDYLDKNAGDSGSGSAEAIEALVRGGRMDKADEILQETDDLLPTIDDNIDLTTEQRYTLRAALYHGKAMLLDLQGNLPEAQRAYRSALQAWQDYSAKSNAGRQTSEANRRVSNLLRTRLADSLLRQGSYVDAELESRKALLETLDLHGRFSYQTATVLQTFARVKFEQGRYREALVLAREVLKIFQRSGVAPVALNHLIARSLYADILVASGKWQETEKFYRSLQSDLRGDAANLQRFVTANISYALVRSQIGDNPGALRVLGKAVNRAERISGKDSLPTLEAGALLAAIHDRAGNFGQSRRAFSRYLPGLMEIYRKRSLSPRRSTVHDQRLALILERYLHTLLAGNTSGRASQADVRRAFEMTDLSRSRSLRSALSASAVRSAVTDPALAELVRREQDAGLQISGLEGLVSDALARTDKGSAASVELLTRRLGSLRQARQRLRAEIDANFPQYADLINPKPGTVDDVIRFLRPDETLVSISMAGDQTYIFTVSKKQGLKAHISRLNRKQIDDMVRRLRSGVDSTGIASLSDFKDFDLDLAHRLFQELLQPLRSNWEGSKSILVVTHGLLASLPFSMLPTTPYRLGKDTALPFDRYRDVPWLAKSHAVYMLPSAASLKALRAPSKRQIATRPFIGFGDPYFNIRQARQAGRQTASRTGSRGAGGQSIAMRSQPPTRAAAGQLNSVSIESLPRLPDSAQEISAIAAVLGADPARDVYLGRRADEQVVKKIDLKPYKIISFATHGLIAGDLDGLDEPALAFSASRVTGNAEDGLLRMSEIFGLRLNAEWVVLSACNTAAGDGEGAEAVSGLGRAFFYAGSRAIMASNWPVHSGATTELMSRLFKIQSTAAGISRAQAYRQAQAALIGEGVFKSKEGRALFSYAHPIFWAPFALIGDGGASQPGS